jgi:hypothetical protein
MAYVAWSNPLHRIQVGKCTVHHSCYISLGTSRAGSVNLCDVRRRQQGNLPLFKQVNAGKTQLNGLQGGHSARIFNCELKLRSAEDERVDAIKLLSLALNDGLNVELGKGDNL